MQGKLNNEEALNKIVKETLFLFFGTDLELANGDEEYHWSYHRNDKFFVAVTKKETGVLFSIDLRSSYNKESQMPIHFVVKLGESLSNRKMKRICEAITFLQRNEKEAGQYFGSIPGFDDLSSEIRMNFYSIVSLRDAFY
jgi:hypothetical protein